MKNLSSQQPRPAFISEQTTRGEYFFLDLKPVETSGFTVVCGGFERCSSDYQVARSNLPFYTLEFIVSGHCSYQAHGTRQRLGQGALFGYPPACHHRIENAEADELQKFFICLHGREVESLLGKSFFASAQAIQIAEYQWIHDLFRQLMDAGSRGGGDVQDICRLIVRLIVTRVTQLVVPEEEVYSPARMNYQKCRAYLESHFPEIRSIQQVAEACHLSRAYVSRLFGQFANRSASRLLIELKMNQAAKLLAGRRLIIKEVAQAVGYSDPLYFSQAFKKHFGVSPKFYSQMEYGEAHALKEDDSAN